LGTALLWGCGGLPKHQKPDLSGYVWPHPPYPPLVKLVSVIRTDLDIRERTAAETFFGERANFSFKKPHGVAVDANGYLLVTDTYKHSVFVLNLEKGVVGQLHNPYGWSSITGIATDNVNGLIGVAKRGTVQIFDQKSKKIILTLGDGKLAKPVGVAFDPNRKRIYVVDVKKHEVHAYDYAGNHLQRIASGGTGYDEVYYPLSVAVHPNGKIYVVDSMNFRVQVYNPDFSYDFSFGQHGDLPGMFARAKDIAISQDGMLFITDAAFGNFQIFRPNGKIFGYVGVPGSGPGRFNQPQGIAIGNDDKIYVVDQTNRRIQVFQYLSEKYLQSHPDEAAEIKKAWDALKK
jgi:DNA-binding beta-propeller fold protein YncE